MATWEVPNLMSKCPFCNGLYIGQQFVFSEASSSDEFSDEMSNSSDDNELEDVDLAERKAAMDKLVPALEPSEYGQMPASFHANSQRVAPAIDTGVDTELNGPKKNSKASIEPEKLMKPIRRPILSPDKYDGVDSDDETDEEDGPEADESEEDQPQVVGEVEVDMGEEEEEFLEFSRQALGISDEQWGEIVRDRKGRGGPLLYATYMYIGSLTSHLSICAFQCDGHARRKNIASATGSKSRKTEPCTRSATSTRTTTQC